MNRIATSDPAPTCLRIWNAEMFTYSASALPANANTTHVSTSSLSTESPNYLTSVAVRSRSPDGLARSLRQDSSAARCR